MEILDRSKLHDLSDIDRDAKTGTCSICGPLTPLVSMNKRPACAIKSRQVGAERRRAKGDAGRKYQREYGRRWRFGLPAGGVEALLAEAGSRCAICETTLTLHTARIDHDHSCCPSPGRTCGGCIRGVLCSSCNTAIGLFGDDPAQLRRAIDYLNGSA